MRSEADTNERWVSKTVFTKLHHHSQSTTFSCTSSSSAAHFPSSAQIDDTVVGFESGWYTMLTICNLRDCRARDVWLQPCWLPPRELRLCELWYAIHMKAQSAPASEQKMCKVSSTHHDCVSCVASYSMASLLVTVEFLSHSNPVKYMEVSRWYRAHFAIMSCPTVMGATMQLVGMVHGLAMDCRHQQFAMLHAKCTSWLEVVQ